MALNRKNLIALLIVLSMLLVVLVGLALYYYWQNELKVEPGFKFLFNISGDGKELKTPLGVALSDNKLFVTDSGNSQVQVFTKKGGYLFSFKVVISGDKKSYPMRIAVGDDGNIYVSEITEQKIMVFDPSGTYLHDFPKEDKVLVKPVALAFAGGKLYVTDVGDQSIKIFSSRGRLLRKFGRDGDGEGEFAFPNGIAVSEDGTIFVADSNNSRVQVFDGNGRFLRVFKGRFSLPRGIATDGEGRIHVVDTFAQMVRVFNKGGKLLFSYGQDVVEEGKLSFPNGIAIDDSTRQIYIANRAKDCVSVWSY
ncbi:MAG: 6-bladed beta-propeller [Actinomycetota bacterium]|nr:6-bladed beta-propeller [Actinomycetota bacterium]